MSTEDWLPIRGYENRYEVSSLGQVRSVTRSVIRAGQRKPIHKTGVILKARLDITGYPSVALYDTKAKTPQRTRVHVLVCETFHGPRPAPGHEVRHLNGDPTDNRAVNLAWGSRSENMADMVLHGNHHEASKTHCKYGHEFTPENTCRGPRNTRGCLECTRRRAREAQRTKRTRLKRLADSA